MPRPRFLKLDEGRRSGILEAAKREFADAGFDGASYNRIIERAGLSKGAMYYYFDDKLDLYVTVLEVVNAEMAQALGVSEGWTPEGDFWDVLTMMALRAWEFSTAEPDLAALMKSVQSFPIRARREGRLGELFDVWRTLLAELLRHGQLRGQVRTDRPIDLLVEVIVAMDEAIDLWLYDNSDQIEQRTPEEVVELIIDFYRRLLDPS